MKIKLTDRAVKALKPSQKRYFVQVTGYPGLQLRVNKTGTISFVYRYLHKGQRRFMSLGIYPVTSIKEAGVKYAEAVHQVAQGIDPLAIRQEAKAGNDSDPTVNELSVRYIENHAKAKLKPRTVAEYQRQLKSYILPKLGKRKAKELKRADIVALVERLAKKIPIQANRTLNGPLKGMFTYAVRVGILEYSPAAGISPPSREQPKDRALDLEEIAIMIKTMETGPRGAKDALLLILLTAARPGEICTMRFDQIKGEWWNMSGNDTKSGRLHRVYLCSWARHIIQERQHDGLTDNYIFASSGKKKHISPDHIKNWLHRNLIAEFQNVGLAKFTAHDLRRTAATGIARLGFGTIVPDILGHSARGVTRQVYDQYSREPEIKRALIAWETAIKEAMAGGGQTVVEVDFK